MRLASTVKLQRRFPVRGRVLVFALLFLALADYLQAATMVSIINARRTGGTATGAFLAIDSLPGMILSGNGTNFRLRSGSLGGNQWEFATDSLGQIFLYQDYPQAVDEIAGFTSGTSTTIINENGIGLSADRFNPDPVYFIAARYQGEFYQFNVAQWRNGAGVDNLRIFTDVPQRSLPLSVPEPNAVLLFMGAFIACFRSKRRCV